MGKSNNNWREVTREIIREYPTLARLDRELKECSITPNLNGMPGGGGTSRKTELTAMREFPPDKQRKLDAVRRAISTTGRYRNAKDRLRVIDLVYWQQTHTLQGAAQHCHYSWETAQEWNAAFIELVDAYMRIP